MSPGGDHGEIGGPEAQRVRVRTVGADHFIEFSVVPFAEGADLLEPLLQAIEITRIDTDEEGFNRDRPASGMQMPLRPPVPAMPEARARLGRPTAEPSIAKVPSVA